MIQNSPPSKRMIRSSCFSDKQTIPIRNSENSSSTPNDRALYSQSRGTSPPLRYQWSRQIILCAIAIITLVAEKDTSLAGEFIPLGESPTKGVSEQYLHHKDGYVHLGDMLFSEQGELGAVAGSLWPNGILVFDMDPALSDPGNAKKSAFMSACQAWTVDTPIICKERTGETDYIRVFEHGGDGCFPHGEAVSCSPVGWIKGQQRLYIHNTHWNFPYVLIHEIGHALGFIHEHQRADRDSFIKINWGNVLPGAESQFAKVSFNSANDYDFDSIMHYTNCLFSKYPCNSTTFPTQTIWPVGCNRDQVGGNAISSGDRDTLRRVYSPTPMSVFMTERNAQCGTIEYSQEQIRTLCGAFCPYATAISWIREETLRDKTCGVPFPANKGRDMCAGIRKEYITHWIDIDRFSCDLGPADRIEIWAKCACSKQSLDSICANLHSKPSKDRLIILARSKASRERSFAKVLLAVSTLTEGGMLNDEAADLVSKMGISSYRTAGFPWRFGDLQFALERFINRKRRNNPSFVAGADDVRKFFVKVGFNPNRTS